MNVGNFCLSVTNRLNDTGIFGVLISPLIIVYTPWVKKGCQPNHGYNFVNSWSICNILSLLQTAVNFQQNSCWVTHHTLSRPMLLHYLGKLKNQKFALCMHVKHVSSVIFFIIYPTDICQMSW